MSKVSLHVMSYKYPNGTWGNSSLLTAVVCDRGHGCLIFRWSGRTLTVIFRIGREHLHENNFPFVTDGPKNHTFSVYVFSTASAVRTAEWSRESPRMTVLTVKYYLVYCCNIRIHETMGKYANSVFVEFNNYKQSISYLKMWKLPQ